MMFNVTVGAHIASTYAWEMTVVFRMGIEAHPTPENEVVMLRGVCLSGWS